MKFILFFTSFAIIFLTGCGNQKSSKYIPFSEISTADSLALVDQLFDSLHAEIYQDERYRVFDDMSGIIYCGAYREFYIQINSNGKRIIGDTVTKSITPHIYAYFNTNYLKNDMSNNSVLYSRISKKEIINQIKNAKEAAIEVENTHDAIQDLIDFKWNQVIEWESKYKTIRTLNINLLKEPEYSACINLDYHTKAIKEGDYFNEILLAFYRLRNERSIEHFNKSYLEVFYETLLFKRNYRCLALKTIQPISVKDLPYCKEHGFWMTNIPAPPPPMPENY